MLLTINMNQYLAIFYKLEVCNLRSDLKYFPPIIFHLKYFPNSFRCKIAKISFIQKDIIDTKLNA